MTLVLTVILVALIFEYINGFHDTANSIATVVSTKVLTPRQAVALAAATNLLGALWGTAVAKTISSGLVDSKVVTLSSAVIICALIGAIVWNLITWWFGLPSSSSHALIGGLCGAALATADNNWSALIWSQPSSEHWWMGKGLLWKVVIPMVLSPVAGFVIGFIVMAVLYLLLRNWRPATVNRAFGKLQLMSAAYMGFSHGTNDAQKTMGIIALALMAATASGTFDHMPSGIRFLRVSTPGVSVAQSMTVLGDMHRAGDGVEQSAEEAGKWYRKAIEKNEPAAMENLAALIQSGQVKAAKPDEAAQLVKKAETTRKGKAPTGFSLVLTPMKDAPTNAVEAVTWYRERAEKGNADAQAAIGVLLIEGGNEAADREAGVAWLQKAADHHNADALFNLGLLARQGRVISQSPAQAAHYFKKAADQEGIKLWIKIICALTMAAGTAAGGWRIIKTLGHKMVKLQPVHGFAAETTGATVLATAAHFGMPVSTTHSITASIMGVGSAKAFNALKLTVVERIMWAWVLTIPASAIVAYGLVTVLKLFGWHQ
jgi:phosphate/sulfate permease